MTNFYNEMAEIMNDIDSEMAGYIAAGAPEQVQVIRNFLNQSMRKNPENPMAFIEDLTTLAFMMFLAGREHALRGYPPPIPKSDFKVNADTPDEFIAWLEALDKPTPSE